jgi:hypothetical protein
VIRTRLAMASALALTVGAISVACSASDGRFVATTPDEASFAPVAQMLVHHCGSLDCHGVPQRNLRLYGNEGLRLAPGDRPLHPALTTADEVSEDFLSTIALEPELTSAVVAAGGAHPERLTLVRKARGQEAHKGGTPTLAGDDSDTCLTSWLAGKTDAAACKRALTP